MKQKILGAFALTAVFLSSTGFADDATEGHFYAEIEGGKTFLDVGETNGIADTTKRQDLTGSARLGYEFPSLTNIHFGVEGGYIYLGNIKATEFLGYPIDLSLTQQGADLLGVIKNQFNSKMNVFLKGGMAYVVQSYSLDRLHLANSSDLDSTYNILPEIAAGLGYKINKNVSITGSINHIIADDRTATSTTAALGFRVDFG